MSQTAGGRGGIASDVLSSAVMAVDLSSSLHTPTDFDYVREET